MPISLENLWIPLVLLFGIFKGTREILKKKALNFNSGLEILLIYTLFSFVLTLPSVTEAFKITNIWLYAAIALKSFFVFVAWICGITALTKMPLSIYGVLDLSGVLFSTLLAVFIVGEKPTLTVISGMVIVCAGLFLLKFQPKNKRIKSQSKEKIAVKYVILAFCYTLFNSMSGTMDKLFMRNNSVSTNQLQFWFMFFLCVYYITYFVIKKIHVNWKTALKNYRIYIMAILLILGDKALFIANSGASTISVMILLKQISCVVVIIGGRIFFKEKNTLYKLFCAAIIICGIVISTL